MDFFGAQEQARRRTRLLVVLFLLAVLGVITAVYLAVTVLLLSSGEAHAERSLWDAQLFWPISIVTTLFIAGGSLFKIIELAGGGGDVVARMLGGSRVWRNDADLHEQRLLNIVDEMAIASGVAAPRVYLLDKEYGINAFAAGFSPQQAVVAVTRGCLERLSRDELQGVIAHEFSHILNGDMRLNLRLIGVLHGILSLTIVGRIIVEHVRGGGRSKGAGGIVLFGAALIGIGHIGVLFGNLIKAAVSRQREFHADAAAVQFTRNPAGIAGALKKIGTAGASAIHNPRAEEASHMFFGEGGASFLNWFSTHPPIEERISRIAPAFLAEREPPAAMTATATTPAPATAAAAAVTSGFAPPETATLTPQQVVESVGTLQPHQIAYAQQLIESLPPSIRAAIQQPEQARSLIYALLVVDEEQPLKVLQQGVANESAAIIEQAAGHVVALRSAGRAAWLPILEMVIPELDADDERNAAQLLDNCKRLIEADGRLTLFEYLIESLLRAALSGKPGDKGTIHRYAQKQINEDFCMVLSLLAHSGHRELDTAQLAFYSAITRIIAGTVPVIIERDEISLFHFERALTRLATLDFRTRARLIDACTTAITHDNTITIAEAELLRIIGAKLDTPIPPLLTTH